MYLEYPALYLAHSSRNTQQMVAVILNAKQIHAMSTFFLRRLLERFMVSYKAVRHFNWSHTAVS